MKKYLLFLLRLILGGIFIYAAIGKILDPARFAGDIDNYRLLPYLATTILAAILPWLEMICGVCLITGKKLAAASLILVGLNLIFIFAIASAMARGLDIDCGCFSAASASKVGFLRLAEDGLFLAGSIILLRHSLGRQTERT